MVATPQSRVLDQLRTQIGRVEGRGRAAREVLSFGVATIDRHLPGGGLALGALHEITGDGLGAVHGTAAALFAGGILARIPGPVLWCVKSRDLFAPALAQVGLHPDRVVYAEAGDEKTLLLLFEEGLRHAGLAGVVAEVSRLPMVASRRLQLAAETSGVVALALRRWRNQAAAVEFSSPTAAMSRWRIAPLPSSPLPSAGIGRPRWRVELVRCRGAEAATWDLEACDAEGHLDEVPVGLPAGVADRPAAAGGRFSRTAA
jgi:protein ImuA